MYFIKWEALVKAQVLHLRFGWGDNGSLLGLGGGLCALFKYPCQALLLSDCPLLYKIVLLKMIVSQKISRKTSWFKALSHTELVKECTDAKGNFASSKVHRTCYSKLIVRNAWSLQTPILSWLPSSYAFYVKHPGFSRKRYNFSIKLPGKYTTYLCCESSLD